jgi:hypothetical protein
VTDSSTGTATSESQLPQNLQILIQSFSAEQRTAFAAYQAIMLHPSPSPSIPAAAPIPAGGDDEQYGNSASDTESSHADYALSD